MSMAGRENGLGLRFMAIILDINSLDPYFPLALRVVVYNYCIGYVCSTSSDPIGRAPERLEHP